jgi:hypothetical protein
VADRPVTPFERTRTRAVCTRAVRGNYPAEDDAAKLAVTRVPGFGLAVTMVQEIFLAWTVGLVEINWATWFWAQHQFEAAQPGENGTKIKTCWFLGQP